MWPQWELQGHGSASTGHLAAGRAELGRIEEIPYADYLPPWFNVRLTFDDGARIDVLAVVSEGGIAIEDMRAQPPLSLDGFAALADWLEGPLRDACRVVAEQHAGGCDPVRAECCGHEYVDEPSARHRARPSWPRGGAGRRIVADAYRAAQEEGRDPVLAVMCATGRSRRKSLKLIAAARDAGYLAPRHNRR
ncbi:DUF6214 family protein [Streptomyces monticola]|uniref:DUF6214 family protein n=1 Tax=Streptomyces monticola TaxID=2666263 RepID=A0ABW2JG36_9ACTN